MIVYLLPIFIIFTFAYAHVRKLDTYSTFCGGVKEGAKTIWEIFPLLVAICILLELFRASGLQTLTCRALSPVFNLFGIPDGLIELVLLRPFSGSATTAIFKDIISRYGVNSYVTRVGAVIMSSSETVFYITAIYFSKLKLKKLGTAIPISLFCSFVGAVLACTLCKIM